MGEEFKTGTPNLFMTFGLGALLLLSVLFSLPLSWIVKGGYSSVIAALRDSSVLFPVAVSLVFATHSIGSLMIIFGDPILKRFSKHNQEAETAYYALSVAANERVWLLVGENRQSLKFVSGVAGILLVHVAIFVVAMIRWCFNLDDRLMREAEHLPIFFAGLVCAVMYASMINVKLQLISLSCEQARKAENRPSPVGPSQNGVEGVIQ